MQTLEFETPTAFAAVERTMDRKPAIARAVAGINRYVDDRIGEVADSLNRGAIIAARLKLVNQALTDLALKIYEVDEAGHPVYVDVYEDVYCLRIPLPWGSKGWRYWRLRQREGRILRKILDKRMRASERVALFHYSGDLNAWALNRRYDTPSKYAAYWTQQPVTMSEWRMSEGALQGVSSGASRGVR